MFGFQYGKLLRIGVMTVVQAAGNGSLDNAGMADEKARLRDTEGQEYNTASVRLVLETMIQAFDSERNRIQALEQKCGTLLGFALVITALMGNTSLTLVTRVQWMRIPLAVVIVCLGIGIAALMYGIRVKMYERPDVTRLLEPEVLTDSEAVVASRLAATWEKAEQSAKLPARQIVAAYNVGSMATVFAIWIVLACLLIAFAIH